MSNCDKAKHISHCLELAMLLEVSAAKPGNVTFAAGFEGTRVEHFLASAVAANAWFEEAANRGIAVLEKTLSVGDVGMGWIMKECAADINAWQKGGNTLLGTVMLLVPLAVAAGMTPTGENFGFDLARLRKNLRLAVESTTAEDAVYLYEAIDIAKPSGLNEASDLDVNDPASKQRLLKENVSLFEVFKIALVPAAAADRGSAGSRRRADRGAPRRAGSARGQGARHNRAAVARRRAVRAAQPHRAGSRQAAATGYLSERGAHRCSI